MPQEEVLNAKEGNRLPVSREGTAIEFLALLAERKWTVARITGGFLLFGVLAWAILPNKYTAETQIMPPKEEPTASNLIQSEMGLGGIGALANQAAGGLLSDPSAIYMGLFKSQPVEDAIIQKFDLMHVYHLKTMQETRDKLESRSKFTEEKSTIITVSVTDKNSKRATDMANAFVDQLRAITRTVGITQAARERMFYEEQVDKQKERLTKAEEDFQTLQSNKGLIELNSQAKVAVMGLADLQAQVAAKEVELQSLKSFSTDRNPDVQIAQRELDTMKEQVAQLQQHSRDTGYSDFGIKDIPKAGLEYLRAERELGYQQTLYNLLVKQFEAAKLDEGRDATIIQVISPAAEPEKPTFPDLKMFVLLSLCFGGISGILFVKIQHRFQLEQSDPEGAVAMARLRKALRWRQKA